MILEREDGELLCPSPEVKAGVGSFNERNSIDTNQAILFFVECSNVEAI